MPRPLPLLALLAVLALPAQAQVPDTPSAQAMAEMDRQIGALLAVPLSGDADIDFMRAMIPHQERAIALADIVLEHGYSPEVRAMAESLRAARQTELDRMLAWLARHE